MLEKQKKIAAAIAAVMACLRDEEMNTLRQIGTQSNRSTEKIHPNLWIFFF